MLCISLAERGSKVRKKGIPEGVRDSEGAAAPEGAAVVSVPEEAAEEAGGYSLSFHAAAMELLGPEAVRGIVAGLIGKASAGDVRAFETLRELAGEALPDREELRVRMEVVE